MSDWFLSQMHSAQIRTSRANPKTENEDPQLLLQVLKASEIVTHLGAGGLTPFFALYYCMKETNKHQSSLMYIRAAPSLLIQSVTAALAQVDG